MLVNKSILLILALSVAGCSNMVPMTGAADLGAAAQASAAEPVVLGNRGAHSGRCPAAHWGPLTRHVSNTS